MEYARAEVEAIGGAFEPVVASAEKEGGGGGGGSGAGGIVSSGEGVGVSATATLSGAAAICGATDAARDSPPSKAVEVGSICIGVGTGAVAGAANSGLISRPAAASVPVESRSGGVGAFDPLGSLPSLLLSLLLVIGTVGAAFFPPNLPPFSRIGVAAPPVKVEAGAGAGAGAGVAPGSSSSGYGDGYWARIS